MQYKLVMIGLLGLTLLTACSEKVSPIQSAPINYYQETSNDASTVAAKMLSPLAYA